MSLIPLVERPQPALEAGMRTVRRGVGRAALRWHLAVVSVCARVHKVRAMQRITRSLGLTLTASACSFRTGSVNGGRARCEALEQVFVEACCHVALSGPGWQRHP